MTGTDFMDACLALVASLFIIWTAMCVVLLLAWAYTTIMEWAERQAHGPRREDAEVADLEALWNLEWTEGIR